MFVYFDSFIFFTFVYAKRKDTNTSVRDFIIFINVNDTDQVDICFYGITDNAFTGKKTKSE